MFEANQNPKVIRGLLGHRSVKTSITTYNSIDKSYFKQAADIFNTEYKIDDLGKKKRNNYTAEELDEIIKSLNEQKELPVRNTK